jgi:hypothetical protein
LILGNGGKAEAWNRNQHDTRYKGKRDSLSYAQRRQKSLKPERQARVTLRFF